MCCEADVQRLNKVSFYPINVPYLSSLLQKLNFVGLGKYFFSSVTMIKNIWKLNGAKRGMNDWGEERD